MCTQEATNKKRQTTGEYLRKIAAPPDASAASDVLYCTQTHVFSLCVSAMFSSRSSRGFTTVSAPSRYGFARGKNTRKLGFWSSCSCLLCCNVFNFKPQGFSSASHHLSYAYPRSTSTGGRFPTPNRGLRHLRAFLTRNLAVGRFQQYEVRGNQLHGSGHADKIYGTKQHQWNGCPSLNAPYDYGSRSCCRASGLAQYRRPTRPNRARGFHTRPNCLHIEKIRLYVGLRVRQKKKIP